jgi:hypothetical protein
MSTIKSTTHGGSVFGIIDKFLVLQTLNDFTTVYNVQCTFCKGHLPDWHCTLKRKEILVKMYTEH